MTVSNGLCVGNGLQLTNYDLIEILQGYNYNMI